MPPRQKGSKAAGEARKRQAREAYPHLIPIMLELQATGKSLREIAEALNAQEHGTRRGKAWSKTQVQRVHDRARPA
jgi:Recombinase